MSLWSHMLQKTATYYWVQTGHRRTAIECAVAIFEQTAAAEIAGAKEETIGSEMTETMRDWLIETLVQGAFLREYHVWEMDTKQYCNDQLVWNRRQPPNWRAERGSHVGKVRNVLSILAADMPAEILDAIDKMRERVNAVKHDEQWLDEHFVTRAECEGAMANVEKFWEALANQEKFSPHLAK